MLSTGLSVSGRQFEFLFGHLGLAAMFFRHDFLSFPRALFSYVRDGSLVRGIVSLRMVGYFVALLFFFLKKMHTPLVQPWPIKVIATKALNSGLGFLIGGVTTRVPWMSVVGR